MDAEEKRRRIDEANADDRCPRCGQPIAPESRVGSGRISDGYFCSLDCIATFHEDHFRERARASRRSQN